MELSSCSCNKVNWSGTSTHLALHQDFVRQKRKTNVIENVYGHAPIVTSLLTDHSFVNCSCSFCRSHTIDRCRHSWSQNQESKHGHNRHCRMVHRVRSAHPARGVGFHVESHHSSLQRLLRVARVKFVRPLDSYVYFSYSIRKSYGAICLTIPLD